MYAPKGKKDGIQLLPIGEVAAKDEFWNIKKVTVEDQLAGTFPAGVKLGARAVAWRESAVEGWIRALR